MQNYIEYNRVYRRGVYSILFIYAKRLGMVVALHICQCACMDMYDFDIIPYVHFVMFQVSNAPLHTQCSLSLHAQSICALRAADEASAFVGCAFASTILYVASDMLLLFTSLPHIIQRPDILQRSPSMYVIEYELNILISFVVYPISLESLIIR